MCAALAPLSLGAKTCTRRGMIYRFDTTRKTNESNECHLRRRPFLVENVPHWQQQQKKTDSRVDGLRFMDVQDSETGKVVTVALFALLLLLQSSILDKINQRQVEVNA